MRCAEVTTHYSMANAQKEQRMARIASYTKTRVITDDKYMAE